MDDITWKARLEQRAFARQSHDLLTLIIIFSLILGGWAWYFFIYTRTPEYALEQLQASIKSHDTAAFHKYANIDLIASKAYDDLTLDMFSYDKTLNNSTKALFEKFYVLVKPTIISGMEKSIDTYINEGSWQDPSGTSILKGQQLGIDFDELLERTLLRTTAIQKIGDIKKEGRSATADIQVLEEYTQTPFTLKVQLEADDNGRWQVSYIKNYRDYLNAINQLQNKDIAAYIEQSQKIIDDYNNLFLQQQARFKKLTTRQEAWPNMAQRQQIKQLIDSEIIPAIEGRSHRLQELTIPDGAQHLQALRLQADELSVSAWTHFAAGLAMDDSAELETAESLHKRSLEVDQKVSDIIKHNTISKTIPEIP